MMSRSAFVMTYFLPDLHPEKLTKHLLCANQNVYSGLASWILKANFSISPQKVRINQFVIFKNDFVWLGELRLRNKQKITTLYLSSAVVSFFFIVTTIYYGILLVSLSDLIIYPLQNRKYLGVSDQLY